VSRAVFVSTACVRGSHESLEELVADFHEHSIKNVELGMSPPSRSADLSEYLSGLGRPFVIHNYFPAPPDPFVLNLAARSPIIRQRSTVLVREALGLSARLGAPFYSVHAGFRADLSADSLGRDLQWSSLIPRDEALAIYRSSVEEAAREGSMLGVRLLVEPNVIEPRNLVGGRNELLLLVEAAEIVEFLQGFEHADVGLLLDVGHLNVSARTLGFDREQFVESVAPWIGAFHVHDNDGTADQHRTVESGSWIFDVLQDRRFRELPVVVESKFASSAAAGSYLEWFTKELT
jgi:sugar phosphate isomerase/epimerase